MEDIHQRAIALVQGHGDVHDWSVRTVHRQSHELYLVREEVESRRTVETERAVVVVHRDLPEPEGRPQRGFSSFTLLPEDSASAARAKLEEALFAAELASNPPYTLPGPAPYPQVQVWDPDLVERPPEVVEALAGQLLAQLAREPQVEPSSAEFYIHLTETRLSNSQGVEARARDAELFVELVVLSGDGHDESEYYAALRRRALRDLDLPAEVARYAARARDSLGVGPPPTRRGPVVVSGQALVDLLVYLRHASSGAMKYQNLTRWELGKPICGDRPLRGEPLTLVADATLPWGVGTAPFDEDGVPGQRTTLVEGGVCRQFWADYRYAQYLGLPATGSFGNLCIPAGATPLADLLAGEEPVFHIVAFASMDPDPITGEFVGEIRLGYDVRKGSARPFKGGALSGTMEDTLAQVWFSREVAFLGHYLGPEAARFGELAVGGD
ncbi:MAG: hypothetical protein H5T59_11180 [Anaerolineae bacterium]|nr:hypothetical protein [Anaerolineae bacterium]